MAKIENISFSFSDIEVFRNLSLDIPEGSISCILGPSGCGKTTLLNLMSKILYPSKGKITGFPESSYSFIFQETRVLPWKTVYDNIAFPLLDKMDKNLIKQKVEKFMDLVELSDRRDNYPSKLSGGMKQRIAIARAFAFPSKTIFMDEAFHGLNLGLKTRLFDIFLKTWKEDPRTVVFVTHDLDEALYLGNQINILTEAPVSSVKTFNIDGMPGPEREVKLELKEEIRKLI